MLLLTTAPRRFAGAFVFLGAVSHLQAHPSLLRIDPAKKEFLGEVPPRPEGRAKARPYIAPYNGRTTPRGYAASGRAFRPALHLNLRKIPTGRPSAAAESRRYRERKYEKQNH